MKKIFAIALAVVMVLSMASAFAVSACATWGTSWPCTPDDLYCGQGKVEVVPYVKVNTSCGWDYQVSDCAAAIRSTDVYWAIKLTVEAYPDPAWWECAILDLETEGLNLAGINAAWVYNKTTGGDTVDRYVFGAVLNAENPADFGGIDYDATTEKVYYLSNNDINVSATNNTWVAADDATFANGSNVVFFGEARNANVCAETDYSVCAKLTSEYDGYTFDERKPYNQAGDYYFRFFGLTGAADPAFVDGEMTGWFEVYTVDGGVQDDTVDFRVEDGVVLADNRTANTFYNKVLADFGLTNCGTEACITKANIKANFGWDDEQEHCFDWSTKGASVVDTDCVVAIPKTGDASVLAWLF